MKPYSLRRRLLLWLFLATAVIGLIALLDTWREALRTAQSVSDRVLAGSALAIAERVSVDETGILEVDIPYSSLEMLTSTAQDKVFYRVDGPIDQFLTGYPDLPIILPAAGAEVAFADGVFGSTAIRSATLLRALSTGARSITVAVTVAESTRARAELARAILIRSALRLAVLILGVAGIVWVAVTVALRPLDRLGAAIAERSPDDLHPITEGTPQEVEALVIAINSFMVRLNMALAALRNFTGNASHQLRTPLAVVRTQLALIDRSTSPKAAAGATLMATTALERAERVLAQLLVLARLDSAPRAGSSARFTSANIAALAKQNIAEMVPEALQKGIDLGYEGGDLVMALAEPVLFAELLNNLLSNALAYAGRGAVVTVRVFARQSGGAELQVEDNGPGLTPEQTQRALSRIRGTPNTAVRPHDPAKEANLGYGFGLAITAEIAALFGGEVQFQTGANGRGLLVCVRFEMTN
jgi:two-component system sensor histidine kinase TctE